MSVKKDFNHEYSRRDPRRASQKRDSRHESRTLSRNGATREAVTHADPKVLKSAQAKEHEAQ